MAPVLRSVEEPRQADFAKAVERMLKVTQEHGFPNFCGVRIAGLVVGFFIVLFTLIRI